MPLASGVPWSGVEWPLRSGPARRAVLYDALFVRAARWPGGVSFDFPLSFHVVLSLMLNAVFTHRIDFLCIAYCALRMGVCIGRVS